jgi:hypothetical protein
LRRSKYIGFFGIGLGIVLIVGAAVMPISPATQKFGPFRIDVRGDNNCGPAGYVAVRKADTECGQAARKRILAASAVGLLVVAAGMALFAGPDDLHGSRVRVASRRVKRRSVLRSLSSRRYKPG